MRGDLFVLGGCVSSPLFRLVDASFDSPVPQALRLARHAEAVPVVGEVAVNKQENRGWISPDTSELILGLGTKQQFLK